MSWRRAIQWAIFHLTAVAPLVALDGRHGAVTASLAVLLGGVGGLFASVIATARGRCHLAASSTPGAGSSPVRRTGACSGDGGR